jgi:hypothetical protein
MMEDEKRVDNGLGVTKRIMERLVKTPPDPKKKGIGKAKPSRRLPVSGQNRKNRSQSKKD